MLKITEKYIQKDTKRRSGQKLLGVKFIVAHDTGNDGSTAMQNVNYYIRSANETEASAHTFIDDVAIISCIPLEEKAWHVRRSVSKDNELFKVDANDCALSVELCFFKNDKERSLKAYKNYVEYISYLCTTYELDPVRYIIGHYVLDPMRRNDPMNAFMFIGKTWTQFIKDIVAEIKKKPIKTKVIRRR